MTNIDKPLAPALTPANQNVWYLLATLHGEQSDQTKNDDLAERNRAAWLRWFAPPENGKLYVALRENGFSRGELEPFTLDQRRQLLEERSRQEWTDIALSQYSTASPAEFGHTLFDCNVSFRGFHFFAPTDFSGTRFQVKPVFDEATFAEFAYFNNAEFEEVASFIGTQFSMRADFEEAQFHRLATFHNAVFSGVANFRNTKFAEKAHFQRTQFDEEAIFQGAKFSKHPDFVNAQFASKTVFVGAIFETRVPDFRGAKLHEATEWSDTITWPDPKGDGNLQQNIYAYERLRQEMERLKKPDDEQSFVRKEFRAKRGLAGTWSGERFLNFCYQTLSNYGNSIARPLFALALLFLVGIPVFIVPPVAGTEATIFHAASVAASVSFANMMSIFPGVRKIMLTDHTVALSGAAKLFAVAQFIIGALLLFLLGLALRNRFRLK